MPTPRPELNEEIDQMLACGHASLPWTNQGNLSTPDDEDENDYEQFAAAYRTANSYFRSLRALHGSKRAAVMVLDFFEFSPNEIARLLHLSPKTVRVYRYKNK